MITKKCITCNIEKDIDLFGKNKNSNDLKMNKCLKCCKDYYHLHRDKFIESQRKRYNKDKSVKRMTEWRLSKFGDLKAKREIKRIKKEKEAQEKKELREYKRNFLTPIKKNIRSTIWLIFNLKQFPKDYNSVFYLGCDYEFLKKHIESQFTIGMDWDNKYLWHIDHIIPLSSAKSKEELYQLCHYSNIQPMWAKENKTKRALIPKVTNLHFRITY